jgi:hypothetical protein
MSTPLQHTDPTHTLIAAFADQGIDTEVAVLVGAALELRLTCPEAVVADAQARAGDLDGWLLALAADVALAQGTMDVIGGAL